MPPVLTRLFSRSPTQLRYLLAGSSVLAYVLAFGLSYPLVGSAAGILMGLPAVVIGWTLGPRAGFLFGCLTVPLNTVLYWQAADPNATHVPSRVLGAATIAALSAGTGWTRNIIRQVRQQSADLSREREQLQEQITRRQQVEQALQQAKDALELQVAERTAQLQRANALLLVQVDELQRAKEASQTYVAQLESLRQMGLEITGQLDLASVLLAISQRAVTLLGGVAGSFYLYQPDRDLLERVAVSESLPTVSAPTRRRGEGLIGKVWENGRAMYVNDYNRWDRRNPVYDETPSRNVMGVPIYWDTEFLGVETVIAEVTRPFSDHDLEFMGLFAMQAAAAIHNAQLYRAAQQAQQALRASEERYALAARAANDGLWDWDLHRRAVFYSARWKSILGYAEEEIGDSTDEWFTRLHPDDLHRVKAEVSDHLRGATLFFQSEHRVRHKQGHYVWVQSRGLAVRDEKGLATRMAGSLSDITDRKRAEEQLLHDAFHDPLTGLPNRALFMDRLEQALERAKRSQRNSFAVLYLDLDRFKDVNDSLGHAAGDQLLVETARRLAGCVRAIDTLARLGGDEFVAFIEDTHRVEDVTLIADRIQKALAVAFRSGEHPVFNSASMGIVAEVTGYAQAEDILRDADIAMYHAKMLGKARYEVFDAAMRERLDARLGTETDLRGALQRHEFRLYYQPIHALSEDRLAGFEALLRWQHPTRGLVAPGDFIPIAESTGLIVPIGEWVLREACRQMREWECELPGAAELTMSVNISSKQITQPDFVALVARTLAETGLEARHLHLEITETTLVEDSEAMVEWLAQLRAIGVAVQIDDFGIGYSSLGYLQRLPIDTLKIDRSFVSRMGENGNGMEIVRAILALAHELGMQVVAEGVTSAEQVAKLQALDCEYGQGYLFAKPLDRHSARESILASSRVRQHM